MNILQIFSEAVASYGDNPACSHLGCTLSYRDLDRLSDAFAAALTADDSLNPGDRVVIHLPNFGQYLVAVLGIFKAGMVVVNSNPVDITEALADRIESSGAKALVVMPGIRLPERLSLSRVWETAPGDLHFSLRGRLLNCLWALSTKRYRSASAVPFATVLRSTQKSPPHSAAGTDLAVLQYTGGTTGKPKAVMLTHDNISANIGQFGSALSSFNLGTGATALLPLPLYHIYAFTTALFSLSQGYHLILIPDPRKTAAMLKTWQRYPVAVFYGLPTLFGSIASHPMAIKFDWSGLRVTFSGGAALTSGVYNLWQQRTGNKIYQAYGLSETSPLVSCNPFQDNRPDTVGLPVTDCEVRVVDAKARVLPVGEQGELQVRGPQVMKGYWEHPDETAKVLSSDGWLSTGDIAVIDEDGYIQITDRLKDLIIVSGFNVYPGEVEECLSQHFAISECAVVARPDEHSGERPVAVVVADSEIAEQELQAWCRERLAAYKVPASIRFVDSLPKSPVGKILRRKVKSLVGTGD